MLKDIQNMRPGARLKMYIQQKGYTMKQFASMVGVSRETLHRKLNEATFDANEVLLHAGQFRRVLCLFQAPPLTFWPGRCPNILGRFCEGLKIWRYVVVHQHFGSGGTVSRRRCTESRI